MQKPDWTQTVHHDGSRRYVEGNYEIGERLKIRLRVGKDAPVERVFLRSYPDGEQIMAEMKPTATAGASRLWEGELPLTMPVNNYRFFILTTEGGWWFSGAGVTRHWPTDTTDFKILVGYQAPDWVRGAVFYQIFPDRFADGDPANNVRDGEYLYHGKPTVARKWGERPIGKNGQGPREFFGGDLQGIIQKLDYLQDLGVTALYLTPIFTAPSSHKYDVEDYRQVDPHFGGNEALVALRDAMDGRAMRLMLDIVPNHSGMTNSWFVQALADRQAPTTEYFIFRSYPEDYESWWGVKSLPKLNYTSLALRNEMYAGEDSIMRIWLRPPYRIDAWRMDVANMLGRQGETQLGHKIGRGIRKAVKAEAPQAYLIGEHFFDGTSHLQGDELDASMNYRGFSVPLLRWLNGFDVWYPFHTYADPYFLPTEALAEQWQTYMAPIPWQIALQQFNFLGSHDVPRVLTAMKGDTALARVAAGMLMTFPGVPCIYYGDEIGMEGAGDPDNRRPMIWETEDWNAGLREFYRKLIVLRKQMPVLQEGGFQLLYAAEDTIAFQREIPGERVMVVARRSADNLDALPLKATGLADGVEFRELLTNQTSKITGGKLPLVGFGACDIQIWQAQA